MNDNLSTEQMQHEKDMQLLKMQEKREKRIFILKVLNFFTFPFLILVLLYIKKNPEYDSIKTFLFILIGLSGLGNIGTGFFSFFKPKE